MEEGTEVAEMEKNFSNRYRHLRGTKDLGQQIRRHRKKVGITQESLALQTGISRPTIRAIEQGKETAQFGLVLQICADIGLDIFVREQSGC